MDRYDQAHDAFSKALKEANRTGQPVFVKVKGPVPFEVRPGDRLYANGVEILDGKTAMHRFVEACVKQDMPFVNAAIMGTLPLAVA